MTGNTVNYTVKELLHDLHTKVDTIHDDVIILQHKADFTNGKIRLNRKLVFGAYCFTLTVALALVNIVLI